MHSSPELAMHTGMRAGEIQALTVDDLGEDEIYVRRSWSKYDGLDKRIAKLELGELNLSEDDVQRISQRFGIA